MDILVKLGVFLIIIFVLVGIIYYAYSRIRDKISNFSTIAFGTASILEGVKKLELDQETTPKTISAATSIYKPSIMRDFPEFHYDEMKTRVENALVSYLRSMNEGNGRLLSEGTRELQEALQLRIDGLRSENKREHYENITIHGTEIHRYLKEKGRCTIVFQTAVGYVHYITDKGENATEQQKRLQQTKYNTEVIYIQNQDMVENISDAGLAMNCPNCGGALTKLGAKVCPYCDSPVIEFNLRVWSIGKITEVK